MGLDNIIYMAKLQEKPCNFLNIKFGVKREKAIVQNSKSTNSIELPRCDSSRISDFFKTEQVLCNASNLHFRYIYAI